MAWQLQLGIDIDLLKKADPVVRDKQIRMLSTLSLMLIVIGLICTFSTMIYVLILFHNWFIAIGAGLFMGLVAFNLYRLLVMTALDAGGTELGVYMSDHEKHIFEHIERETELTEWPEERILELSARAKQQLREKPLTNWAKSGMSASSILTMVVRVLILGVMALIFANGMEIFMFKGQINAVLEQLRTGYAQVGDTWMVTEVLTPKPDDQFYVVKANSLLLVFRVLAEGLDNWKIILDLFFIVLFFIPLSIVFRSNEIIRGEYVKEWVLSSVTISFYHYLTTEKYRQQLTKSFKKNIPGVFYENAKSSGVAS
jgi:hypothetical protein